MPFPNDLQSVRETIEDQARQFGLDFWDVYFEMLDYMTLNQVAAYDGFPVRYPHWRFGMEYERLSKSYAYGLHRIYEMVINNDPCYAYLLSSNQRVDQKLVIAHVFGHADFFKNNLWFSHTNRKMLDEMANHAARVRRHVERKGIDKVESFLDACLSVENLIDIHIAGIERHAQPTKLEGEPEKKSHKIPAKNYMDAYINPPEYLASQVLKAEENEPASRQLPVEPERDVLIFLLDHAPLDNWQRDLLSIVREEAYYFAPQRQTKIMNEGWASFAHTHIMVEYALEPDEVIDYADHHSGTVATQTGHLNPYKLGLELYRDIEDRWNRGAFGSDYDACDDLRCRQEWDLQLGLGRQKVFEVRRIYNDIGFIDEFLTEDFALRQRLFTFDYNKETDDYEISGREFVDIKKRLLFQLTNFGQPIIDLVDANHGNRGELYLLHRYEGVDLDIPWAKDTLKNLYTVWGRPVWIESVEGLNRVIYGYGPEGDARQELN